LTALGWRGYLYQFAGDLSGGIVRIVQVLRLRVSGASMIVGQ
jgi:hypothetical protein